APPGTVMSSASSSTTLPLHLERRPEGAQRPGAPLAAHPAMPGYASQHADSGLGPESSQAFEDVAEVVASFGDRVVDVAHLGRCDGRVRRRARLALGLGLGMIGGGLGLFAYEAAQPWAAWAEAAREAVEIGASAPAQPGWGSGGLGLGLALFGLVPLMGGALRLRERPEFEYSVGEGPSARMTVSGDGLPTPDHFAVVRNEGGQVALRFTPSMRGHVQIGSDTFSLAQLISAAPVQDGAHVFALRRGATAQVEQ